MESLRLFSSFNSVSNAPAQSVGRRREEIESKFDICLELSELSILRMREKSKLQCVFKYYISYQEWFAPAMAPQMGCVVSWRGINSDLGVRWE